MLQKRDETERERRGGGRDGGRGRMVHREGGDKGWGKGGGNIVYPLKLHTNMLRETCLWLCDNS